MTLGPKDAKNEERVPGTVRLGESQRGWGVAGWGVAWLGVVRQSVAW